MSKKKTTRSYFSPKKGAMKTLTASKKTNFYEDVCDISQLKSEFIEIKDNRMVATKGGVSLVVETSLGVSCVVDTKKLKRVAKTINDTFSVTKEESHLVFVWGESSATLEFEKEDEDDEAPIDSGIGEVLVDIEGVEIAPALLIGGFFCREDGPRKSLQRINYDGEFISSTDNVGLAHSFFEMADKTGFSLSPLAYNMWVKIDKPLSKIKVHEKATRMELEERIAIVDHSLEPPIVGISSYFSGVLDGVKRDRLVTLPQDFWENMKSFKEYDVMYFKNGEIGTEGESPLKFTYEDFKPLCDDNSIFRIKTDLVNSISKLVLDNSTYCFVQLEKNAHTNNYLIVIPEVGMDDTLMLAGMISPKGDEVK